MPARPLLVLCALLAVLTVAWFRWWSPTSQSLHGEYSQTYLPVIIKQPVAFTSRTFDPTAPPADMPPLASGENAECATDFVSNASVAGESRKIDATHAIFTIKQVKMTLQLNVTIWVPIDVTAKVVEHEQGHRQISEHYYQSAGTVAQSIAAAYMGKQVELTGADLGAESSKMLQQTATDITNEYNKEVDPGPAQLLYDSITDHSRNDVIVSDAIATAIASNPVASALPVSNPAN